jgi:hypothetical protein
MLSPILIWNVSVDSDQMAIAIAQNGLRHLPQRKQTVTINFLNGFTPRWRRDPKMDEAWREFSEMHSGDTGMRDVFEAGYKAAIAVAEQQSQASAAAPKARIQ